MNEFESEIPKLRESFQLKLDEMIGDKVRVDEVQDALKRLTESNQSKLEHLYQELLNQINQKNDD